MLGAVPERRVDHPPLRDPLAYGRTALHPLPAPILGHFDYQADPVFAEERARLLARLSPGLPGPRHRDTLPGDPPPGDPPAGDTRAQGSSGRSCG